MKKFIILFLSYSIFTCMGQGNEKDFEFVDTIRTLQGDVFNGHYKTYYNNGKVKTYSFLKNGLVDSFVLCYYKSGKIRQEVRKTADTLKVKNYDSKGILLSSYFEKNDTLLSSTIYYGDKFNSIKGKNFYQNGKRNGYMELFYPLTSENQVALLMGSLKYINGKRTGLSYFYYNGMSAVIKRVECYSNDTFCWANNYDKNNNRTSFEVNSGNSRRKKGTLPIPICDCDRVK